MPIIPAGIAEIKTRKVQEIPLPRPDQSPWCPIHTVCGDEEGNLYLSDELNHSIIALDNRGEVRWTRSGCGSDVLQFRYPRGMACGVLLSGRQRQRCLAVADGWNRRIQFLDPDGRFLGMWSQFSDTRFGEVCDIRYLPADRDRSTADCDSGIWVILDKGNHCLFLYSMSGQPLLRIGRRLIPAISRRWTLPGSFVAQAGRDRENLQEFAFLDYLYFPARLVGDSESTLHVWEPHSRSLKRLLCGQLLPVPQFPENLSEWICASQRGLLGWDAENGRLLYCGVEGKLRAEIPVAGVPVASNLAVDQVWIQLQDRLQRIVLAERGDVPEAEPWEIHTGSAAVARAYVRICSDVDGDTVTRRLFRETEGIIGLTDEILRLSWPDAPKEPDYGSFIARLSALASKFKGLWRQFREVIHPWSVEILGHTLASATGDEFESESNGGTEAILRWRQVAERLQCRRDRLVLRSDALFAALNQPCGGGSMPDDLRNLLEEARSKVNEVLTLQYGFSVDPVPSDSVLRVAPGTRVFETGAAHDNRVPACLDAPAAAHLAPCRVLDSGYPSPSCVAFGDEGDLWVIDRAEKALYRVHDDKRIRVGAEVLSDPRDLTPVHGGMTVADGPACCIRHLDGGGRFSPAFELPYEEIMALDCAGDGDSLYVAVHDLQSQRGRILILSAHWQVVGEIVRIGSEDLGMPVDLTVLPGGHLAVVEWREKARIRIISPDGKELFMLTPRPPLPQDWSRPRGVCSGPGDSVFISDDRYGCVRWFDSQFQQRLTIGKGILTAPQGIACRLNRLVVADAGRGELLEFDLRAIKPDLWGPAELRAQR